ncbi:Uncharacterised protein at_DN1572 [Pycnogonum litorale]
MSAESDLYFQICEAKYQQSLICISKSVRPDRSNFNKISSDYSRANFFYSISLPIVNAAYYIRIITAFTIPRLQIGILNKEICFLIFDKNSRFVKDNFSTFISSII